MNRRIATAFFLLMNAVMTAAAFSQVVVSTNYGPVLTAQECNFQTFDVVLTESKTGDFPGEDNQGKYYTFNVKLQLPANGLFTYNTSAIPSVSISSLTPYSAPNVSLNGTPTVTALEVSIPLKCNGMNQPARDQIQITNLQSKVALCTPPGGVGLLTAVFVPVNPSNSTATFQPATIPMGTNGALPVELVSFIAQRRNNIVSLKWSTATETNNYGFDVERSFDRDSWEKIGFVTGSGTTSSQRDYAFDARLAQRDMQQELVSYRLRQIDRDGSIDYSPVVSVSLAVTASTVELKQNFPNPFNPATNISFNLPASDVVSLSVYNELGVEVARIHDGAQLERGWHTASFNATELPSGLYMYRMQTSAGTSSRTMMLMK